jgi:phosphoenolpyruvate carboxykinase (GTP)
MFRQVFDRDYTQEEYDQQFSVRVDRYLEKIARMEEIYRDEPNMPAEFWEVLETQKGELLNLKAQTGKTVLEPAFFHVISP